MERPITVFETKAICHPWKYESSEILIDHSNSLRLIRECLTELSERSEPKIILIEGRSGSGKSVLAKVIESYDINARTIDVCKEIESNSGNDPVDISSMINDPNVTYIVDETAFCDQMSLYAAIFKHVDKGGVIILFAQCASDLVYGLQSVKTLTLERSGLSIKK